MNDFQNFCMLHEIQIATLCCLVFLHKMCKVTQYNTVSLCSFDFYYNDVLCNKLDASGCYRCTWRLIITHFVLDRPIHQKTVPIST